MQEHAEGIKALVRGLHLIGSLELRGYAGTMPPAPTSLSCAANSNLVGDGFAARPRHRDAVGATKLQRSLFNNRRRFFQLSNDLTTLRWSWREYLLLDEVVRVTPNAEREDTFELHAGTVFKVWAG